MPTVLVVDDDSNIRKLVERLLGRNDYASVLCGSAEDALEKFDPHSVDVVLLDLRLPGDDGLTFLREIKARHGRFPVVLMSGAGTMDDAIGGMRLRASDFLQKPFQDEELLAALRTALADPALRASAEVPADSAGPSQRVKLGGEERKRTVQSVIGAMKEVERRVAQSRIDLPVLDARLSRVQGLMQRPSCGVDEVLDLVGKDQGLAATCLRAANSSLYNSGSSIHSLRQACVQLGNRRVMTFASEALAQGAFVAQREPFVGLMRDLWRNALVTARVAEHLARVAHRTNAVARGTLPGLDELYVAALLHNIGELLLLHLLSQIRSFEAQDAATLAVLGEALHARHESFGGGLARKWSLPRLVVRLAGAHHRPGGAQRESEGEILVRNLVLAAWSMALRGGYTCLPSPPPPDPDEYLEAIAVDPETVEPLYEQMAGWLEGLEPATDSSR